MYLCIHIATHLHTLCLDWLPRVLESNSRSTWKWRSSEFRETLRGRDRVWLEMYLEAVIERVGRCTWRLWSSQHRDGLHNRDEVSLLMHMEVMTVWTWEAVIKRVWWYTWRTWLSKYGDALGGRDRASSVIYIWRPWWCQLGGRHQVVWRP